MAENSEAVARWRAERSRTLEIDGPTAICGDCGFTSGLSGVWSVEDGRLVFRADANPLQRRGPDFFYCGESREVVEFTRFEIDGREVSTEDLAALRMEAERASQDPLTQIVGDLQTGEVYEEPLPPPVTPAEFITRTRGL